MNKIENAKLVEVNYSENGKQATLLLLDSKLGEIHEIRLNKQAYDSNTNKWRDDEAKAQKIEALCVEVLGVEFKDLSKCVGNEYTIYCYEKFCSFKEVNEIAKFTEDMAGFLYSTEISEVVVDDIAIRIHYLIDGKTYETKHTYAKYLESMKQWFVNPQDKAVKFEKFKEKYGVSVEDKDKLIGHPITVEVRKSFSSYYGDIKKFVTSK